MLIHHTAPTRTLRRRAHATGQYSLTCKWHRHAGLAGALILGALQANACRFGYDDEAPEPGILGGLGGAHLGEGGVDGEPSDGGVGGAPEEPILEVCGNGIVEANEVCDEGLRNGLYYGDGTGCTKFCTSEPNCRDTDTDGCDSDCGDGLRIFPEECDDANLRDGDGCSATCEVEDGFTCTTETLSDSQPCSTDESQQCLNIPIIYRDFIALGFEGGHEDMLLRERSRSVENGGQTIDSTWLGLCTNMVDTTLSSDGKPRLFADYTGCVELGGLPVITSAETFLDWYSNSHPGQATYLASLELPQVASSTFQFSNDAHFPLDGLTQGAELEYCAEEDHLVRQPLGTEPCVATHNYHFTSEVRYIFRYQGGEVLDFLGDDDVWVFVNGQKVLDLGGVHGAAAGTVDLDDQGLTPGRLYEILVFHADRHPVESRYQLSLRGFEVERTTSCTRR